MVLQTNIRLGWKGLPGTNTLADFEHSYMKEVKSFITLGPGHKNTRVEVQALGKVRFNNRPVTRKKV